MKICDRHHQMDGSPVPATQTVFFGTPDEVYSSFDLCESCAQAVADFINATELVEPAEETKPRGRPKKAQTKES